MASHPEQSQPPSDRAAVVFAPPAGCVIVSCDAMGTRFDAALIGGNPSSLRAAGELAMDEIRSLHNRLSAFDPSSVVARLNRAEPGVPIRIAGDVFHLLESCRAVWMASGGCFDPTIGPLMRHWGFREGSSSGNTSFAEARRLTGFNLIELDATDWSVRVQQRGLSLDLGAIAKGHALDMAVEVLRSEGIESAFLHGGTSSIAALGSPPDHRTWKVRIPPPLGSASAVAVEVHLRDASLSVSAPQGRVNAQGAGHVIDPRSGTPVPGASLAAVLGPSGRLSDAWSTALLVEGARPAGMPPECTAIVHGPTGWSVDGPGKELVRESPGEREFDATQDGVSRIA